MGLREVKTELKTLDKADLIKLISVLYKKYKPVKEYLDFYVDPDEFKMLEIYKERVAEGFFPKHGDELRLSISRKAINDFKKLNPSVGSIVDLLLHYVECGVRFTNAYGDIDENFYASVERTYRSALELMHDTGLLQQYQSRAWKIVEDSSDIGWGFHDDLTELYYDYYS